MTTAQLSRTDNTDKTRDYSFLLEKIIEDIEVPDWFYKNAEERYEAVGAWLRRDESKLAVYTPHIYVQGSFLLGTANRPILDEDGCDIDLVCCLNISKEDIEWGELKKIIGDELKANGKYERMLEEEGRRCWTIVYSENEPIRFHLDILPAIPNDYLRQEDNPLLKNPIFITDKILERFMGSNPKGYVEWFKIQMMAHKPFYDHRVKLLSEQLKCEIEAVPTYVVKTPLQQVIQLLKRHRDLIFKDKSDEIREAKPISIIITTLAAKAYASIPTFVANDLYTIAKTILQEMPNHISEKQNSEGKTVRWVENPTDKTENFADKWEYHPEREISLKLWLEAAKISLDRAFQKEGIHNISESLKEMFGEKTVARALTKFHENKVEIPRSKGTLAIHGADGTLGEIGKNEKATKVPKNTFYGGTSVNSYYNNKSGLNLATQKAKLNKFNPIKSSQNPNRLVWEGQLQPTLLSEKYTIRIIYNKNHPPKVFVENPKLRMRLGEIPPHLYDECNLCLYYPKKNEWNSRKLLSKTIIPWASLWLYYYEIWLATGNWLGGGIHPPQKENLIKNN